jgi:hypothetical protein
VIDALLAYRPFIDTLENGIHGADAIQIYLVIPLVIGISIIYKGTKVANLRDLPRHAAIMTGQIFVVLIIAAIALYGISMLIVHNGPPH